jgi:hypothetical protein
VAHSVFNTDNFSEILFYIVRSTFIVEDISGNLCYICGVYLIQTAQYYMSESKENFVSTGEKQAAVQHDTWGSTGSQRTTGHRLALITFALLVILNVSYN